jgi:hypothetical protein
MFVWSPSEFAPPARVEDFLKELSEYATQTWNLIAAQTWFQHQISLGTFVAVVQTCVLIALAEGVPVSRTNDP